VRHERSYRGVVFADDESFAGMQRHDRSVPVESINKHRVSGDRHEGAVAHAALAQRDLPEQKAIVVKGVDVLVGGLHRFVIQKNDDRVVKLQDFCDEVLKGMALSIGKRDGRPLHVVHRLFMTGQSENYKGRVTGLFNKS
jgi:hypothetical protein